MTWPILVGTEEYDKFEPMANGLVDKLVSAPTNCIEKPINRNSLKSEAILDHSAKLKPVADGSKGMNADTIPPVTVIIVEYPFKRNL
jgi:hypothetical protein